MKFLCPNCKAKYQIADEKVAGKTLRMDCRRCGHAIVIRPETADVAEVVSETREPSNAGRRPSTRPPASASSAGRRPAGARASSTGNVPAARTSGRSPLGSASSLGAELRRPSLEPKTTPLDQWHVAINDVPVGPMRRDEIARKIAAGAVTGDSLSWREGFDDWRPLRDIPELSSLLRKSVEAPDRPMPRPPPPRAPVGRAPTTTTSRGTASPDPMRASARSNVVPIGGRLGAAAAPAIDEDDDELAQEPTTVGSASLFGSPVSAPAPIAPPAPSPPSEPAVARASFAPPRMSEPPPAPLYDLTAPKTPSAPVLGGGTGSLPAVATTMPLGTSATAPVAVQPAPAPRAQRQQVPFAAWIALAGAVAFGGVFAYILGTRMVGAPATPPAAAVATPTPTVTPEPTPAAPPTTPEAPVVVPEVVAEAPPTAPTEEAPADPTPTHPAAGHAATPTGTATATGRRTTGGATGTSTGARTAAQAAEDERFARMGEGSSSGAIAAIPTARPGTRDDDQGSATGSGQLSDSQIASVVNRERPSLSACWQLELRRLGRAPDVRLDISVTIGASGTVTRVTARGQSVGALNDCIERSVRRWRFPTSGSSSEFNFPLVFTGTS